MCQRNKSTTYELGNELGTRARGRARGELGVTSYENELTGRARGTQIGSTAVRSNPAQAESDVSKYGKHQFILSYFQ